MQAEQQLEAHKIEFEKWKTQMDNDTRIAIAELQANNSMKQHVLTLNSNKPEEGLVEINTEGNYQPNSALSALVDAVNTNMAQMLQIQNQNNQAVLDRQHAMIEQMGRPKQVVRDPNTGKIIGVQ